MREILYRAISMATGEHWLYGLPRHYAHNPHTEKWTMYDPTPGIETDIDEETLGQYTGAIDKNGKKIFEGDILYPISKRPYLVFWDEKEVKFALKNSRDFYIDFYQNIADEYIVIGNIHDNPELLKGGEK